MIEVPSLYHGEFYAPVLALSMLRYPVRFAHFPLCVFLDVERVGIRLGREPVSMLQPRFLVVIPL